MHKNICYFSHLCKFVLCLQNFQTKHPGSSDVNIKVKMAQKMRDERNALAKKTNMKQEEKNDVKQANSDTPPNIEEV